MSTGRIREVQPWRRLTALAITNARMTIDINACATIIIFAQRAKGMTSVMLIGLVRRLPDKEEREAAEGGALPLSTDQTAHPS
jgi:hypothetical protein